MLGEVAQATGNKPANVTAFFYSVADRKAFKKVAPLLLRPSGKTPELHAPNKQLDRDITDGRDASLHPFWFVDQIVETEALAAISLSTLTYIQNRGLDGFGNSMLRFGGQQGFVLGTEGLIDSLPGIGLGQMTGHGLLEAHNLELYGGLSMLYAAAETLVANSDLTQQKRYSFIARRSQVVATKVVVSKAVAIISAKIAGLSTKGATLGSTLGPAGTVAGFAIGLGAGVGFGWYWHYQDAKIAEEHYAILTEAIGRHLQGAPA